MRASYLLVIIVAVSIVSVGFKERYPGEIDLNVPKGYRAATKIQAPKDESWKSRADQAEAAALLAEQFESTKVAAQTAAVTPAPKATPAEGTKKASTSNKTTTTKKTVARATKHAAKKPVAHKAGPRQAKHGRGRRA